MKSSLQQKLQHLVERHDEISYLMADPEIVNDQQQYRNLLKEYSQLEEIVTCFNTYKENQATISASTALAQDADKEMRELAQEELQLAKQQETELLHQLQYLLLPRDPNDDRNIFLEIRAGAGGSEAAIFVGDLFRMYARYAETCGWQLELINSNPSDYGGFTTLIARISGERVYSSLKFESGCHRVQRIPETESQGRIHTSTCTVAIMPEVDEIDDIEINPADLKTDTFRASGAGGQHVNKTDSAIRITHLPTGIVVECQDERSQHKNRARALSLLLAKLQSNEQEKQQQEQTETRRNLVGSGDRSERIRTYNFPQNRVTDHRINLTLYKLSMIMDGSLDMLIEPLVQEHQADLLNQQ